MGLMHRAERAIDDTKAALNGAVVLGLAALVLAAVALAVAVNRGR